MFKCTACAVLSENQEDVIVGFEVHDSWRTTSVPRSIEHNIAVSSREPSQASGAEGQSDSRGVAFDICPSDGGSDSSGRKHRKTHKMAKGLDFCPDHLCALKHTENQGFASGFGKTDWIQRVNFRKTCVDLHSRGEYSNPKEIVLDEASVLFECRHPNILLMLGFCLAFSKGPVLIMERAWGTLTAALRSGPLPLQPALSISSQVASALLYLHDRGMLHGQVRTNSVFLVSTGSASPVTAKLANFATIKHNAGDCTLAGDVLSFGVLLHDLFATNYSGGSTLEQLSELSLEQLKCNISFADLGLLLHSIFRGEVTFAIDVAEWFTNVKLCFDELDEQALASTQYSVDQGTHRDVHLSSRLLVPLMGSAVQGQGDFRQKFSL